MEVRLPFAFWEFRFCFDTVSTARHVVEVFQANLEHFFVTYLSHVEALHWLNSGAFSRLVLVRWCKSTQPEQCHKNPQLGIHLGTILITKFVFTKVWLVASKRAARLRVPLPRLAFLWCLLVAQQILFIIIGQRRVWKQQHTKKVKKSRRNAGTDEGDVVTRSCWMWTENFGFLLERNEKVKSTAIFVQNYYLKLGGKQKPNNVFGATSSEAFIAFDSSKDSRTLRSFLIRPQVIRSIAKKNIKKSLAENKKAKISFGLWLWSFSGNFWSKPWSFPILRSFQRF